MTAKASPSSPVTVALVEDHPEFTEALTHALKASEHHQLIGVAKDLNAGLQMIASLCPDVLLVDLGLPSGSGFDVIRAARRRWGERCTSAVVTMTGDENNLMKAVAIGAKGYLFKSDAAPQWLRDTSALAHGQSPLHSKIAQRLLHDLAQSAVHSEHPARDLLMHIASGYTIEEAAVQLSLTVTAAGQQVRSVYDLFLLSVPDLSPRELQLLSLLNKGYAFRTCAELMKVSESTTKTQAARAYQKLGASNLQMALYEARSSGLIA